MEYRDQLNRIVDIPNVPSRIVSLVPSQTELLVDMGLQDKIVGITKFCVHPTDLKKKTTVVGGTKSVHLNKIKDLDPDFIFCNKEENTLEMVEDLEAIAPVWVSDMYNIKDCKEMILQIGSIFHSSSANTIVSEISERKRKFDAYLQQKNPKKVLYLIWKDPYMAAGRNTFINHLLQLNNFENAILNEDSRYPKIDLQDFPEVDMVLLSTEPYPFKEKDALALREELNKKVIVVDGEFFSWYGSRLLKAFDYFKTLH